jgi:hypothetical protein
LFDPRHPVFKKTINPGNPYSGVRQLTDRLQRLGDLPQELSGWAHDMLYKHFQGRHGLLANGSIAAITSKIHACILQEPCKEPFLRRGTADDG